MQAEVDEADRLTARAESDAAGAEVEIEDLQAQLDEARARIRDLEAISK